MSIPVLTFFNNKGGVGKTTLVYHLSWMFSELGIKTLVVDCDPQANLSGMFVDEEALTKLWDVDNSDVTTIYRSVLPLTDIGDVVQPKVQVINQNLSLIVGDLGLSVFEDQLSEQWNKALADVGNVRAMKILTAFWRVAQSVAKAEQARLIVFDVGPNLGAINRSALIGTDWVVIPLGADMFSLQGLRNLGPALKRWRDGWRKRMDITSPSDRVHFPDSSISPLGYIAFQFQERLTRPVKAFTVWLNRIPAAYRTYLDLPKTTESISPDRDENCLELLRHYKSLMPMAQEARKPIFHLKAADGASGSNAPVVSKAHHDFKALAEKILGKMNISAPALSE